MVNETVFMHRVAARTEVFRMLYAAGGDEVAIGGAAQRNFVDPYTTGSVPAWWLYFFRPGTPAVVAEPDQRVARRP